MIFVAFGASFHFSKASLPYFIPRAMLEIATAQIGALAIRTADLSTFSFLRLITIPILLVIDLIIGYKVTPIQMLGVLIIFGTLFMLLAKNQLRRRGQKLILALGLLAPINLSLFKYDITHYNSVAAEQIIIYLCILSYFTVVAWFHTREKTWAYLYKSRTELQSMSNGLGSSIGVFAYTMVPASVATTFSRGTELLLAILFGNVAFHERKFGHKITGFAIVITALILVAIN